MNDRYGPPPNIGSLLYSDIFLTHFIYMGFFNEDVYGGENHYHLFYDISAGRDTRFGRYVDFWGMFSLDVEG